MGGKTYYNGTKFLFQQENEGGKAYVDAFQSTNSYLNQVSAMWRVGSKDALCDEQGYIAYAFYVREGGQNTSEIRY